MQNDAANLYCPKPTCQTLNRETHRFCQKCRTPLPRRYLWVIGKERVAGEPGQLIANRYLRKSDQIVLDTKPGLLPALPEEVPADIIPYLRLFPHRLHLPHVYGYIPVEASQLKTTLWLLESAPIDSSVLETNPANPVAVKLQPAFVSVWPQAYTLRQLNWLWQIAHLWQPFQAENVASSLLNLEFLRVEGPLVRLHQLQIDSSPATLAQLGQVWLQWAKLAQPAIQPFLEKLSQQLIAGQIQTGEQLVAVLDRALKLCGADQTRLYEVETRTDTGPSRRRNEDACYPTSGTHQSDSKPLVIVCDGIGGHEGGNVASASAIAAIRQHMGQLRSRSDAIDPLTLTTELEKAVCVANDVISERNNDEQRQGRQRMGTTLVMALAQEHELYISHVGDSRAYWITKAGCYQVTLDDDVASREVRLGYALYRDAIQQPAAGSLVQALGMGASGMLHPTAQRFVIDDESVFVLCSDGLSDNDRVEQYWETEILPILTGESTVTKVVSRLVQLANTQNGHDNVTIALIHCQLTQSDQAPVAPNDLLALLKNRSTLSTQLLKTGTPKANNTPSASTEMGTQLLERPRQTGSPLMWLLLIGVLLLLPALAYGLIPEIRETVNPFLGVNPNPNPLPPEPTTQPAVAPNPAPVQSFAPGSLIRIQNSTQEETDQNTNLVVQLTSSEQSETVWSVPAGTILQVLATSSEQAGLQPLKVCWTPDVSNSVTAPPQFSTPAPSPITNLSARESPAKLPVQSQPSVSLSPTFSPEATPSTQAAIESGTIVWLPESSTVAVALPILAQDSVKEILGACTESEPTPATPSAEYTPVLKETPAPSVNPTLAPEKTPANSQN